MTGDAWSLDYSSYRGNGPEHGNCNLGFMAFWASGFEGSGLQGEGFRIVRFNGLLAGMC